MGGGGRGRERREIMDDEKMIQDSHILTTTHSDLPVLKELLNIIFCALK